MSVVKLTDEQEVAMIERVRVNPGLYDTSEPNHSDRQWLKNCWQRLSEELDFKGLDANGLKAKWKNRRDDYMRRKNKLRANKKSGSGAAMNERGIKGKFFHSMVFLDAYTDGKSTTSNMTSVETQQREEDIESDEDTMGASQQDINEEDEALSEAASENTKLPSDGAQPNNTTDIPAAPAPNKDGSKRMSSTRTSAIKDASENINKKMRLSKKPNQNVHCIDTLIKDLSQGAKEKGERIEKMMDQIEDTGQDDFWMMLARRVREFSPRARTRMENEAWMLYMRVRELDDAETSVHGLREIQSTIQQPYTYPQHTVLQAQPIYPFQQHASQQAPPQQHSNIPYQPYQPYQPLIAQSPLQHTYSAYQTPNQTPEYQQYPSTSYPATQQSTSDNVPNENHESLNLMSTVAKSVMLINEPGQ